MISEIEILKKSGLFAAGETDDLKRIIGIMEKRDSYEGESLAVAEDTARFFFLLISGALLLSMENGRSVVMDKPGDFIGFEVLSYRGVYKSTLISLIKGEVFIVNRNSLLEILQENSLSALNIINAWHDYRNRRFPFVEQQELFQIDY